MTAATIAVDLLVDARADLAEGPIWHPKRRLVSWVDIYAGRVNWVSLSGTEEVSVDVGRRVGSAVATTAGALMLATDEGFVLLDDDGRMRAVAAVEPDTNSFLNDGKCDAAGRFWAGTIAVGDDGLAVVGGGSLYRLEVDGSLTRCLAATTLSNGMDWSPDGKTFYYADSHSDGVDAFDFDLISGGLRRRRRVFDIASAQGFADGLCVDGDGCIWTAVWGASEVRRYTPSGKLEQTVPVPVTQPTSVIFAGDDLDVLVITTASHQLSAEEAARQPHAGSLFCCAPGVSGLPTHTYGAVPG